MRTPIASLEHRYRLHTLTVSFRGADPAVIGAMDLRLRGFRSPRQASTDVRLEFRTGDPPPPPGGTGRPVYDTPYGSLEYFPDSDLLYGRLRSVTVLCDAARGVAYLSAPAFVGTNLYLATHPVATVCLMEMLKRRGLFCLHAGCVADRHGRGILVCGPSGAGKSTLSLALVRGGLGFLSDDLVFMAQAGAGSPVDAVGFADAIGVSQHAASCFPEFLNGANVSPSPGFPKPLRRITDIFAARPLHQCRPKVLVFPAVTGEEPSRLSPMDRGGALVRLVPDVLVTEPAATQAHLDAFAALLDQVLCYELGTGRDLAHAAELVQSVL